MESQCDTSNTHRFHLVLHTKGVSCLSNHLGDYFRNINRIVTTTAYYYTLHTTYVVLRS
jgi:hypothetical protein